MTSAGDMRKTLDVMDRLDTDHAAVD